MRLTCPECDAQYEVEDSLIPPSGRSVECARCGHMWHQPGIGDGAMRLGDAELSAEIPPPDDEDSRPRTSAAALDILREEAARELAARAAARARAEERAAASASPEPAEAPPEFIVAEVVDDRDLPAPRHAARTSPEHAVASLEWREVQSEAEDDASGSVTEDAAPAPALSPVRAQGYGAGFGLALALTAAAVALYLSADTGDGPLGAYRATVDGARAWLQGLVFGNG